MSRRRREGMPEEFSAVGTFVVLLVVVAALNPRIRALLVGTLVLVVALAAILGILYAWSYRRSRPHATQPGWAQPDPSPVLRVIPLDREGIESALSSAPPRLQPPPLPRSDPSPAERRPPGSAGCNVLPTPNTALSRRLRAIDWFQFEKLMAAAFRKQGWQVERRGGAHADDGVDLVLERPDQRIAVQCKHWQSWKIAPKTVREMLGAVTAGRFDGGRIIALSGFTEQGRAKAAEYSIEAWAEPEILALLREADAEFDPAMIELLDDRRKFCPRCEAAMVLRTAKRGSEPGSTFWGCSRHPACVETLPVADPTPSQGSW